MRTIITSQSEEFLARVIPKSWKGDYKTIHMNDVDKTTDLSDVYTTSDDGFDFISRNLSIEDQGFSKELARVCNDKYMCRKTIKSMQGLPFTLGKSNGKVEWPQDVNEKLIAKPIGGCASRGIQIVRHGDTLPDIQSDYIIEKYVDDKYPRISIDGYVCGDTVGILAIVDSVYQEENPAKFEYLATKSKYDSPALRKKYVEVVNELKEVTKCNNQIIDVEFFLMENKIIGMEINPRVFVNILPVYQEMCGYNPLLVMESLKKGKIPVTVSPTYKSVVCLYNYNFSATPVIEEHNSFCFTSLFPLHAHTYAWSDHDSVPEVAETARKLGGDWLKSRK